MSIQSFTLEASHSQGALGRDLGDAGALQARKNSCKLEVGATSTSRWLPERSGSTRSGPKSAAVTLGTARRALQEPSKIHLKSYTIFDNFLARFLYVFFLQIFHPQIQQQSDRNPSKSRPNSPTTKIANCIKKLCFAIVFATSAMPC